MTHVRLAGKLVIGKIAPLILTAEGGPTSEAVCQGFVLFVVVALVSENVTCSRTIHFLRPSSQFISVRRKQRQTRIWSSSLYRSFVRFAPRLRSFICLQGSCSNRLRRLGERLPCRIGIRTQMASKYGNREHCALATWRGAGPGCATVVAGSRELLFSSGRF